MMRRENKMITDMLSKISDEDMKRMSDSIERDIAYLDKLKSDGYVFNTNKSYSLVRIKELGFNPIGISVLMCEETFIFDNVDDSQKAYEICEKENGISGFWYAKSEFLDYYKVYEKEVGYSPKVYWLK